MKSVSCARSLLTAILTVIGIAACGGGGDAAPQRSPVPAPLLVSAPPPLPPAPPSPFPAATSATSNLLATGKAGVQVAGTIPHSMGEFRFASGHLVVVDPASPTTPVALESAGQWHLLAQFEEGAIDVAVESVSNLGPRFLVYLKDRRLHRLDLRRANRPPAPALLSSLMTTQICGADVRAIHDRLAPERSWLIFTGPGSEATCSGSNDRQLAVRVDMSESDPPLTVKGEVIGALRTAAGAITGFVTRDGKQVQKVDAVFANPVNLFALDDTDFTPLHDLDLTHVLRGHFLYRDGSAVRAYSPGSGNGPVAIVALAPGERVRSDPAFDASNVYLIVDGINGGRLLRVTDALVVDEVAGEPGRRIHQVLTTPSRLIYSIVGSSGVLYRSVPKAGGAPITIAPGRPCPDYSTIHTVEEYVWYSCWPGGAWDYGGFLGEIKGLPTNPISGIVRSDGTQAQEFENAKIVGLSHANPMPLRPGAPTLYSLTIARGDVAASVSLRAYDGATGKELVTHGSFADMSFGTDPGQWGAPSLLIWRSDIYFYQSAAAGMTRVTNFAP